MSNNVVQRVTSHGIRTEKTTTGNKQTREKTAGGSLLAEQERILAEMEAKHKALQAKNAELERLACGSVARRRTRRPGRETQSARGAAP